MGINRVQAEPHRDYRNMRSTCLTPAVDLGCEVADVTARNNRDILRAEFLDGPAMAADAITQSIPSGDSVIDATPKEDEAVRYASPGQLPNVAVTDDALINRRIALVPPL